MLSIQDYRLPEQLDEYRQALRRFVKEECDPLAQEIEETNALPPRLWDRFREAGLFRLTLPRQYGGIGLTAGQYGPLLEEIAHSHGTIRLFVHIWNWIGSGALMRYGTDEQRRAYLPAMVRGESTFAFALTEPDAGTGTDIRTSARRDGDVYYLTGNKHLVSCADHARAIQVIAYTDRAKGENGITMFVVEKSGPGVVMSAQPDGMGMRGSFHGAFRFEDAPVPAGNLLGEEGQGLQVALDILDTSRVFIGLSCVGLAQELLDRSVAHTWKRVTFGKPLAQRQAIQGMIANMATEIAAARALAMAVVARVDAGEQVRREASQVKLFGLQMVGRVADWALEIHGGIGYLKETAIERYYRDSRALWFEEGSPTIQRQVIARDVLAHGRQ